MISTISTTIDKLPSGKELLVTRFFDAPVANVWQAWTDDRLLDKWWAPKPWRAETKSMDFRKGGIWLYTMIGPNHEPPATCRVDFGTIEPQKSFIAKVAFCDEDGNLIDGFPKMHWQVRFQPTDSGTTVIVDIRFETEADLQKIVEMGFKEGFTMAHGNLDELLAAS